MNSLIRWGVKQIVEDLLAKGLEVAGMAKALVKAGATSVVRQQSGSVFAAAVAKQIQTVITDVAQTQGGIAATERLAGAIAVNIDTVCDRIKSAARAQLDAQVALERVRVRGVSTPEAKAAEDSARLAREAAETELEMAIPELGRLVSAG